jgi:hypothetical protein
MSHFRNNVKDHLKNIDINIRSKIVNQIFGYNAGDGVYHEGMVDADSTEVFDTLYTSVMKEWEGVAPNLVTWFDKSVPMIKQSMLSKVRTAAGLGSPPKKCYTHSSESNNHVIKHKERYQEVSLPKFVQYMKELRRDYDEEFIKAITGRGEYKMKYPHLALTLEKWFRMTVKQREGYVKKLRSMSMEEVLQGECSVLKEPLKQPVSVPWEEVTSPLDNVILSNIWMKTAKVLTSEGAIQCAPYMPGTRTDPTFLVISESRSDTYNTVWT